jgi:hypothetical protein
MIPRFRPITAAWVRSLARNLDRMFLIWLLTVSSLMESCAAICRLVLPSVSRRRTRISAGVSVSSVACHDWINAFNAREGR